jgi:hypothetical protein
MSKTFLASTGLFAAGAAFGLVPPTAVMCLVGQANSLYWMGQMSPQNMPESFKSYTDEFHGITLDTT